MVANGFLSENVLYSWFALISYEDHVLEHKHTFVSVEEPNGCRPFLVHCGSLGHTRAAHGGVEPLYCSQCGSFEHRAKEHVHYLSACHTSANGCGQRGHSKVTAGACVFNINDLKKLTPKEALDELMGPQSAQRTVVMAFQKFLSPEEELAATLYEVIEDAIGRFTKLSFEMSLFMDLFFKYVRDLRLLGGDLRYPHLDMSLGLNAFFAVAAPLDGDEDHADTLVPLLNTFRDTEWLGCVKRAARHGYKRTSRIGLGQIMRTASQGYVTAAMNSVKENLHDRVRAWTICRIRIRLHKHGRFGPQQPNQGRTLTKGETTAIATHFVNSLKFWDPREHPANTNRPFTLPNNELYDKVTTDPLLLEICRDRTTGRGSSTSCSASSGSTRICARSWCSGRRT
ncbi:hypothetical protein DFJ74DRAFT_650632 [Hyaloraphidium curvatum]|nr:hypothetical protein DFJ74DRAFT_650632 [Hyaloraphidium curvatum]